MVSLYIPAMEELRFREEMMNDEETMSYNRRWGGTIPFPPQQWEKWYRKWIANRDDKYFYRYVQDDHEFVGEVAYHRDDEKGIFLADVLIYAPRRGKGYGKTALMLLCESAAKNGIKELHDSIAVGNPAIQLFLRCGFEEEYRTEEYVMLKKTMLGSMFGD